MIKSKIGIRLALVAGAVLALSPMVWALKINDIVVRKFEGVTEVVISCDDVPDAKDFTMTKPDRLILDIKGATIGFGNKTLTLNRGGINTISTSHFDREGGIARVVIEMSSSPSYILMTEESDIVIKLTTKETAQFAEWKASTAEMEVAAAPVTPAVPALPPSAPPAVEETPAAPAAPVAPVPVTPAVPAPVVEETPAAPAVPVTPTPAAPAPVVEQPAAPYTPPTAAPQPPSTPPPVVEEMPATPVAPAAPPQYQALPATPMQPALPVYVAAKTPGYPARGKRGLAGKRVSLNLENSDIIAVLRGMAQLANCNLIIGGDVKGNISMRLKDVPWVMAFNEMVKSAAMIADWGEDSTIIRVGTPAKMQEEVRGRSLGVELKTMVYYIQYAVASELSGSIQKILSDRGGIQVDKRTNALVITDVADKQAEARNLIVQLDTPTQQVEIIARIIDVDMDATKDLGINWSIANVGSYAGNLETKNLGPTSPGIQVPQLLPTGDRPGINIGTIRSFAQLNATISALESDRKANTISNPRISATNNKEAKIVGGKKIPISLRDESGNTVTSMYTIGMVLTVTPHINSAQNITMDVKTEISDLDPTATILGGVVILTNEATTQIMINDGETAVIGGLLQTKGGKSIKGVPILMNIPFIGALFRSTSTATAKREILIFLTPNIIK
ncbi:AMIN domain-containing protein [candidate division TA06 bacterium]|uniref:AMIN domain-containing protein n=1 Tax=candidate division TA06 bacterium TaxID=2250710 RepID=A0A933MLA1_UNCT6|nr:AMIN domain-containing protein [candidate division TA06 bacterium]